VQIRIDKVIIGNRHRKDMGDLEALADSITTLGLLQPIGVTPKGELVFGYRRLLAYRDILDCAEIECREVNVTSIVEGEYAENEIRKDFTIEERYAIFEAVEAELKKQGERRGRPPNCGANSTISPADEVPKGRKTRDEAAQRSGFGNEFTVRQVRNIIKTGDRVLIDAMNDGTATIPGAERLAAEPPEQRVIEIDQARKSGTKIKGKARAHAAVRGRRTAATVVVSEEDFQRRQTERREARRQAAEEAAIAGNTINWRGGPVIMFGKQMWPVLEADRMRFGNYTFDQLFFAIHQFEGLRNMLAQSSDSPGSKALILRERLKPTRQYVDRGVPEPGKTMLRGYLAVIQLLADLYRDNPEGICRPPYDPVIQSG